MEKVFKIGGQFYPVIIGQFYAAIDKKSKNNLSIAEAIEEQTEMGGYSRRFNDN
jgi:hypothetical protein